jgi:hypothetical protein
LRLTSTAREDSLTARRPTLVIVEATGGLQTPLVAALAVAGIPTAVVLQSGQLVEVSGATLDTPAVLTTQVVPLTCTPHTDTRRPLIEVVHGASGQRWLV